MLETADLDARLTRKESKEPLDRLDLELAQLQRDLQPDGCPVLVVFEGWDAAGKGSVLNRLLQPLDPRGYKVQNIKEPTVEERMHPALWRFWLTAPARGSIAIYNHSWYRQVLNERIEGDGHETDLHQAYERIRTFERQLHDDGAVVVKFFLHISKKEQAKRFKSMAKDSAYAWKVGKAERRQHKKYAEYHQAIEDMLRETSTSYAPWTIVPATDENFADVTVAETLHAALKAALGGADSAASSPVISAPRRTSPLDRVDLSVTIDRKEYDKVLPKLQTELRRLQHQCYFERKPVIIVYEGTDASGKGGNIRRLTRGLDPRGYEVVPVGAPQGEERRRHYLWRFWSVLPKAGHFTVFDRSWYGRVLVERVEGLAKPHEWERAYREINEFEQQLVEFGAVLVKFYLHISKDEQLNRFKERETLPHKRWKLTDEDWRNRERWVDYWDPVSDMIERTSTPHAPWIIVEGNDKRYARIKVLRTVIDRLSMTLLDTD
jgi:polyphosphate:AMP phosphotransferase